MKLHISKEACCQPHPRIGSFDTKSLQTYLTHSAHLDCRLTFSVKHFCREFLFHHTKTVTTWVFFNFFFIGIRNPPPPPPPQKKKKKSKRKTNKKFLDLKDVKIYSFLRVMNMPQGLPQTIFIRRSDF